MCTFGELRSLAQGFFFWHMQDSGVPAVLELSDDEEEKKAAKRSHHTYSIPAAEDAPFQLLRLHRTAVC